MKVGIIKCQPELINEHMKKWVNWSYSKKHFTWGTNTRRIESLLYNRKRVRGCQVIVREKRTHLQFLSPFNAQQFHHLPYISNWDTIQILKGIRYLRKYVCTTLSNNCPVLLLLYVFQHMLILKKKFWN